MKKENSYNIVFEDNTAFNVTAKDENEAEKLSEEIKNKKVKFITKCYNHTENISLCDQVIISTEDIGLTEKDLDDENLEVNYD